MSTDATRPEATPTEAAPTDAAPPEAARPGARSPEGTNLGADDLARLLDPPLQTGDLPGVGGQIRRRPEDFEVVELPAYGPDGRAGAHLLLTLRKRGVTTEDALVEIARQLGVPRAEIGLAGLKDKDAVTEQWISLPAGAAPRVAEFHHEDMSLGTPHPHGNKLRRGHLHGNRFTVVVRELAAPVDEALARCRAKLDLLAAQGGLDNLYGVQRLGDGGSNLVRGLQALARGRRRGAADFLLSAGQSTLFNLYALERRARGLMRTVLAGDILKKTATGGLFTCTEPDVDQARLDAGELGITGPMYGSKMRAPPPDSPSGAFEAEILARGGVELAALKALGSSLEGTRRPLQIGLGEVEVTPADATTDERGAPLGPGISLRFALPAGSYATALLRELQRPA